MNRSRPPVGRRSSVLSGETCECENLRGMDVEARRGSLGATFQVLLGATAISNLGDGIRLAALPLLATKLTDSPLRGCQVVTRL